MKDLKTIVTRYKKEWVLVSKEHLIMLIIAETGASYAEVEALL